MPIKASEAFDKAGLKATELLVAHVRQAFGKTAPDSLAGEPSSLVRRSSAKRTKTGSTGTRVTAALAK
jgi:hypothetical protein